MLYVLRAHRPSPKETRITLVEFLSFAALSILLARQKVWDSGYASFFLEKLKFQHCDHHSGFCCKYVNVFVYIYNMHILLYNIVYKGRSSKQFYPRQHGYIYVGVAHQTGNFFAATAWYFEGCRFESNGPMWTKTNLGTWNETQTKHMLDRAKSCVLHLGNSVRSTCWSKDKNATKLQKKTEQLFNSHFHQHTEKICIFFTEIRNFFILFHSFFSLFNFVFYCDFRKENDHPGEHIKILNFCPWIILEYFILEYFSAIFSRCFLLGRWTQTPAALGKTNKLQWWGKTVPTQNWFDKMCILEIYFV